MRAALRYAATARWLSSLERIGKSLDSDTSGELPPLAVIVGHWRSRTTLLHYETCPRMGIDWCMESCCYEANDVEARMSYRSVGQEQFGFCAASALAIRLR